jgi:HK97 gp10 family phage protein
MQRMAENVVECHIEGLDAIQKALAETLPKEARLAMRIALSAGGGTVKDEMQARTPVETGGEDSGFLRDHIKVKVTIKNGGLTGKAIVGATNSAYPGREGSKGRVNFKTITGKAVSFVSNTAGAVIAARVARWLEFGTTKMAKHPFMTQAWESTKETARDRIIAKLKQALHLS